MGVVKLHELKRCPFCEGLAEVKQIPLDTLPTGDARSGMWVVGCDGKNGALCPGYIWKLAPFYTTRELAVECWNTRPPLAVLDEASVGAKLNWKKLTKKTMPPVGANVILWCDLNTGAPIAVVAHVWPDGVLRFWNFHGSEELTPDQYRRTRWAEIPAPAEERYGKDR